MTTAVYYAQTITHINFWEAEYQELRELLRKNNYVVTTASNSSHLCRNQYQRHIFALSATFSKRLFSWDINNAIINQPEPLDKLKAPSSKFDDYYDLNRADGTGNDFI